MIKINKELIILLDLFGRNDTMSAVREMDKKTETEFKKIAPRKHDSKEMSQVENKLTSSIREILKKCSMLKQNFQEKQDARKMEIKQRMR